MGDLTKNLSRNEIKCKCGKCSQDTIDYEIVKYFQLVCDECARLSNTDKVVATITSGNRCESHNAKEGGKPDSKHLKGKAIDFIVRGFDEKKLLVICGLVLPVGKFYAYSPAKGVVHLQLTC
jgi:uncharacterized protein YcbK (DUF882 family)